MTATDSAGNKMQVGIDYYRCREAAERNAAHRTTSEDVRALRIGIAERYARLAAQAEKSAARELDHSLA